VRPPKVPSERPGDTLQRLVDAGVARHPVELGLPDVAVALLPDHVSLSDLLISERDQDRSA
jgi:hypothetical protein